MRDAGLKHAIAKVEPPYVRDLPGAPARASLAMVKGVERVSWARACLVPAAYSSGTLGGPGTCGEPPGGPGSPGRVGGAWLRKPRPPAQAKLSFSDIMWPSDTTYR